MSPPKKTNKKNNKQTNKKQQCIDLFCADNQCLHQMRVQPMENQKGFINQTRNKFQLCHLGN